MQLVGVEPISFELDGRVAAEDARDLVPKSLELERTTDGTVPVRLLVLEMRGIHVEPLSGASADYREALWQVGVLDHGAPAWFSPACDIDDALARGLAKMFVRYRTRAAAITLDDHGATIRRGRAHFVARLGVHVPEAPVRAPNRPLLTGARKLYVVPWHETTAPWQTQLEVEIGTDDLSAQTIGHVTWSPRGLLCHDREHRCGVATLLR